mmetsp:Transcript_26300/g.19739  ORF Transcript_26300/g.19739 Transcript_26300/m.19739 type:complete len:100 (-) Transcript_26300:219-518(-)
MANESSKFIPAENNSKSGNAPSSSEHTLTQQSIGHVKNIREESATEQKNMYKYHPGGSLLRQSDIEMQFIHRKMMSSDKAEKLLDVEEMDLKDTLLQRY